MSTIQRQVGYGAAELFVFLLGTLQFLQLLGSNAAILLTPTIKVLLRDPVFSDRIGTRHFLFNKNLNLP